MQLTTHFVTALYILNMYILPLTFILDNYKVFLQSACAEETLYLN